MKKKKDSALLQLYMVAKFYCQRRQYLLDSGTLEANKRCNDAFQGLLEAVCNASIALRS